MISQKFSLLVNCLGFMGRLRRTDTLSILPLFPILFGFHCFCRKHLSPHSGSCLKYPCTSAAKIYKKKEVFELCFHQTLMDNFQDPNKWVFSKCVMVENFSSLATF